MPSHSNEFDIIVAGGGPAGCVVAGRLARADPNLQVCLVEMGQNNHENEWVYRPGIYVKNMQRIPEVNDKATFYTDTQNSAVLRGRKSIVPCANILGGGSSINFQMYTRASASDWDDFKQEGWKYDDLLPLMKRLEYYQHHANNDTHGYDGPIAISNGGQITNLAQDYLRATHALGIPFTDDLQDCKESHAAGVWQKYINEKTGRRSDAAHGYIHPVRKLQNNLHLRTNCKASRVIFEGDKAVGVAYVVGKDLGEPKETIIKARKCVVLAGGTLGTPQILERSGVGNAKLLKELGIPVVSDLPGVGEEYQDHYTTLQLFRASEDSFTGDDFLRGDPKAREKLFTQWENHPHHAQLSSNMIDAGVKIRPTAEELKEMGPEFQKFFKEVFGRPEAADKPVIFSSIVSAAYADHTLLPPGKYFTMFTYLEIPASRGRIHISSLNPYAEPTFDSGFMNNKADFAPLRWAYKVTREIARRMDAYRGELKSHHPHFHPASPAACHDIELETARRILPDCYTTGIHMGSWHVATPSDRQTIKEPIKYTKEDDQAIDEWVADHVETTWHSLGTCAMRDRAKGGVVDNKLNVYGTKQLKIADLSICPENLCTNTYSSALLCGEKCAQILLEELGLKAVIPHVPEEHRI